MMPRLKARRTKEQDYTFILWGDRFEESAVATFVTELRNAGLCVKVVGLAGQRSTGKCGLILYSDVTLGDALAVAHQAICVIVPCNSATMQQIDNDPRLLEFFRQAHSNHAQFIVSEASTFEKSSLKKLAIPLEAIPLYAEHADLTLFARETAVALMNKLANL